MVDNPVRPCYAIIIETNKRAIMLVRFVNRGYKTDDGLREAEVVGTDLSIHGAPELVIQNPWWSGETLKCQWEDNEWVCDLD